MKTNCKQFQNSFQKNGKSSHFEVINTSLALNFLRILGWDYTMYNTETNSTAATGCECERDLYTCHWKTRTGHILDWKTNKLQNMSRNIYDCILGGTFLCFCMLKFRHTKYTQIVRVNSPCCQLVTRRKGRLPPCIHTGYSLSHALGACNCARCCAD